jgi:hypothetical protein
MEHRELIFTIDEGGSIHMIVKGIDGPGCCRIVKDFETLGQVVTAARTAQYYESQSHDRIRQGVRRSDDPE